MTKLMLVAAVLLVSLSAVKADTSQNDEQVIGRLMRQTDSGDLTFRLEITERFEEFVPPPRKHHENEVPVPGLAPVRMLKIDCISGCSRQVSFSENVDDILMGAWTVWGIDNQFVTLWGGATTTWIRVYSYGPDGVQKVLEAGTDAFPNFEHTGESSPEILLVHNDAWKEKDRLDRSHRQLWRWDGTRYQLVEGGS